MSSETKPWKYNVFNPQGIEVGDTVRLKNKDSRFPKGKMVVATIRGRFENKIWCEGMFTELYAECFKLVKKGGAQ